MGKKSPTQANWNQDDQVIEPRTSSCWEEEDGLDELLTACDRLIGKIVGTLCAILLGVVIVVQYIKWPK